MRLPPNLLPLAAFMVASTSVGMTLSFSYPLLSFVLEREGVPTGLIGLNASLAGAAVFVLAPWLPRLINRLGAAHSVLAGQSLCIACFVAFPFHIDLTLWSVLRFLLGAGIAIAWIACETAINALAEEATRARIVGVYATVFCIGYALGPILIEATGTEGPMPFLVAAALLLCGLPPLALARGTIEGMATAGTADLPRVIRLAPMALLTILAFGFVETTIFALMPVYGLALGHTEGAAALLISVFIAGNLIFQLPVGWLADRTSRRGTLAGCVVIGLVSLLVWPWIIGDVARALPLLLVSGGLFGALYTLSLTLLGEQFRGGDLTVANTAFVLLYQAGAMTGPPIVGQLMATFGSGIMPVALAAALGLLLVWLAVRATVRPA